MRVVSPAGRTSVGGCPGVPTTVTRRRIREAPLPLEGVHVHDHGRVGIDAVDLLLRVIGESEQRGDQHDGDEV
jgi:hypothetical protein